MLCFPKLSRQASRIELKVTVTAPRRCLDCTRIGRGSSGTLCGIVNSMESTPRFSPLNVKAVPMWSAADHVTLIGRRIGPSTFSERASFADALRLSMSCNDLDYHHQEL